jgi:UTP:GlnB (protein PII) uridylyltransferase
MNIAVDMGETNCFIKVHAPDRRGLLQDILKALQLLPMDVHRAAVTTNTYITGVVWVTDIFELTINVNGRIGHHFSQRYFVVKTRFD